MRGIKNFLFGFHHIGKGIGYLWNHRTLWPYAVIPIMINVFLLVALIGTFFHFFGDFYDWLSGYFGHIGLENPQTWYGKVVGGFLWIVDKFFQLVIAFVSMMLLLFLSYAFAFIVSSPFNDILSERVEILETGMPAPPFSLQKFLRDIWRTLRAEFLKTAFFLGVPLVLLLLALLPIIGGVMSSAALLFFGAFDIGFNYVDYPMARKALTFSERLGFARRHAASLCGLGSIVVIPCANLLLMTPLVVAGTLLYIRLHKE